MHIFIQNNGKSVIVVKKTANDGSLLQQAVEYCYRSLLNAHDTEKEVIFVL